MTKEQREDFIKKVKEMPIDNFQESIIKALCESGIKCKIGVSSKDGFIPLSDFFYEGCLTDESKRLN